MGCVGRMVVHYRTVWSGVGSSLMLPFFLHCSYSGKIESGEGLVKVPTSQLQHDGARSASSMDSACVPKNQTPPHWTALQDAWETEGHQD